MSNSVSDLNQLEVLPYSQSTAERQRSAIGIFDSGIGGLTVLRELYRQLPNESIVYFGDTARLPYGNRSAEEIIQFAREIITWMIAQNVKMVLMACNTSSALALKQVRNEFNLPILGLIIPGANAAVQVGKRIGVIATPATAASSAYRQAIVEIDSQVQVWQVGCPEFVTLIEQNRIYESYTQEIAQQYLTPLLEKQIDTLIYGCTHYPHLEYVLRKILPPTVKLIDPAKHLVAAAHRKLEIMSLKNPWAPVPTKFCVSGEPQNFAQLSQQWLGYIPKVERVCLQENLTEQVFLKAAD